VDQHARRGAAHWRLPHHRDGLDRARRARPSFGRQRADGAAVVLKYDEKCELFSSGIFFKIHQRWRFTSARSICNVASTNLPHPNVGRGRCSI
jgi:hypothetical protein